MYTFALFDIHGDPDQDNLRATADKPWVHWMRINVQGLDYMNTGEDLVPYLGPVVAAPHVFAIYRQPGQISVADGTYNALDVDCPGILW